MTILLGAPLASGQSSTADFTSFDAEPMVLGPSGGTLTVLTSIDTDADAVNITLELDPPGAGSPTTVGPHHLAADEEGHINGEIQVPIGGSGPHGWWTVKVDEVQAAEDNTTRTLSRTGTQSAIFLVHPDRPVAGLPEAPWPQTGGDPMHTGRTLALGPSDVDVVRWDREADDGQPFHEPVIGPDGTVYAVTWGGEVYAITQDGELVWSTPVRLRGNVMFPPALSSQGDVIVGTDEGEIHAITATGDPAWSVELDPTAEAEPLSPPVIGPDGTINVIAEPWSLVRIDSDGTRLSTQALDPPAGYSQPDPVSPTPIQGPPVAVAPDGDLFIASGNGVARLTSQGSPTSTLVCNCTPVGVSLAPGSDVVLVTGDEEVVALSTTQGEMWRTGVSKLLGTKLEGTPWSVPTISWGPPGSERVYIASEDGWLHTVFLSGNGQHIKSQRLFQPIRGQMVVDANGYIYVANACQEILSINPNPGSGENAIRWTEKIDTASCPGIGASPVITPSGGLLWPGPDGVLRMLGSNQIPTASFDATWTGQGYRFDAGASKDPDGSPLSYSWDFGDGETATGLVARHAYPTSGTYTVKLTVSDGLSTVSASQTIDVNFPPEPVIVDQGEGLSILLNASATNDPEGDPITYNWTLEGQPAGNRSTLAFHADATRVYDVTLTVSDGNHEATRATKALAPARSAWSSVTLALYDGSCPSGICSFPETLSFTEGDLVELLIVNGGSRTVAVDAAFDSVPGGTSGETIAPNAQGTLHLETGEPGTRSITVAPVATQTAATRIPVTVDPRPAEVTWKLIPPEENPRVGSPATYTVHLEGSSPPGLATFQVALTSGATELTSTRVTASGGEPINLTVPLAYTHRVAGDLTVGATVQSTDTARATVIPPPPEDTTHEVTVLEPTLTSRITSALTGTLLGPALLATGAAAAIGAGGYVAYRRGRETGQTEAPTPSTGKAAAPAGDGTVAASFMPRKVERFHIDRVLGEGGFGTTYLAKDTVLERDVVLKEIEHVGHGHARELLLHEARTAANLSHANVVIVHDVIEDEGRLLLVMEHVEGGTLADRLKDGPISEKRALSIFSDILGGLQALHGAGIVHRDLKPSNILLTEDGVAKITDFGVAARLEDTDEEEGAFVGTPRYMAPEQLEGRAPGPRADLYAAGTLLYEMLTGNHHLGLSPGKTPPPAELVDRHPILPADGVAPALNRVLDHALAREPEDRYESAKAFLDALRNAYRETEQAT